MSSERDEALKALHTTIGTVDPAHMQAEDYGKGIKAVQKLAARQGHVMSEALANSAALWEHKKKIEAENRQLKGQNHTLTAANENLRRQLEQLEDAHAKLQASGGDRYRALYEETRKALNLYLADALDEDQLDERAKALHAQKLQLDAEGIKAPALPDRAAVDEHMADVGDL